MADTPMTDMEAVDVIRVLECLRSASIRTYVAGGWAVDALVQAQTRPHGDLDLAFDASCEDRLLRVMQRTGFTMINDERPVRFVLSDQCGRLVDFHPVTFDGLGNGVQPGFGNVAYQYPSTGFSRGVINGTHVDCLSAEVLVRFHLGYTPMSKDRWNMAILRDRLGIALPAPYS